jgi:hypothetical protein
MKTEITLDAIRSIIAEEIRRFAEEQAAAKAARPKARIELTAEEAAKYMTVDEVAAVTGYGVPSLRSMAAKKMTPEVFPLLPVKVGVRSLYERDAVMASAKAQQFVEQANGFIATPKVLPPTQIIEQPSATATGAAIQNAINAAEHKMRAAKKATAPAKKATAPAAKKAAVKAPAAKKAPAKKVAAKR